MARKIKLTDSVSISELKHMREVEGLSNAEIAKRIGCAVSTVIAHIGKQPKEMTKRTQLAGMHRVKQEEPSTPVGEPAKHHESFADLVARVKAEAAVEKNKKELGLSNAEPEPETRKTVAEVAKKSTEYFEEKAAMMADRKVATEADKAREAHTSLMEKLSDSYTLHGLVDELVMVFGHNAAVNFLKCRLYEYGFSAFLLANREDYVKELNRLCGIEEDLHD